MTRFALTWVPVRISEEHAFARWCLYQEDQLFFQWAQPTLPPTNRDCATAQRIAEGEILTNLDYRITEWTPSPEGGFTADAEPVLRPDGIFPR